MRSLLFFSGLLVFFGMGKLVLSLILLLSALLWPGKSVNLTTLLRKGPAAPARKTSRASGKLAGKKLDKKQSTVALHKGLAAEFIHSKRFAQIINANLHFLAPLSPSDAIRLLQAACEVTMAGKGDISLNRLTVELLPGATETEIDSLCETALRKVQSAITQTRAERLECTWYIWRTCQDERVRPAHAQLEGVVCSFLDPPRPEALIGEPDLGAYHPGEARECRCYAETMIDPDFESWPKKAVIDGTLVSINIREFKAEMAR